MVIEDRLKQLQVLLSHALSGAVLAKTRYLALADEVCSTPGALARAKMIWQQHEVQKAAVIAQIVALEELDQHTTSCLNGRQSSVRARSVSVLAWRNFLRIKAEKAKPIASIAKSWRTSRHWWVPV
jgi:hypothetical protein